LQDTALFHLPLIVKNLGNIAQHGTSTLLSVEPYSPELLELKYMDLYIQGFPAPALPGALDGSRVNPACNALLDLGSCVPRSIVAPVLYYDGDLQS
jgi:hypothetical protein